MRFFRLVLASFGVLVLSGASLNAPSVSQGSMRCASVSAGGMGHASEGVGAAVPTFDLPLDTSGYGQLPQAITANSTEVTPYFLYEGHNASGSTWTATIGSDATETGSSCGTNPIAEGVSVPSTDSTEKAVDLDGTGGQCMYTAALSEDIGTDDLVIELVWRTGEDNSNNDSFFEISTVGVTGNRIESYHAASGTTYGYAYNGSTTRNFMRCTTSDMTFDGRWNHMIAFFDASDTTTSGARTYVNGAYCESGSSVDLGDLTGTARVGIGGRATAAGTSSGDSFAWVSGWKGASWFAGGATNNTEWADIARERFQRLTGTHPTTAAGTALASVTTRASTATVGICDPATDAVTLYKVGNDWPRVGSWCGDWGSVSGAAQTAGYLSEASETNEFLYSEEVDNAGWAKLNIASISADAIAAPDGATTADGVVTSSGSGVKAVSGLAGFGGTSGQSFTVSGFVKKGSDDYVGVGALNCTTGNTIVHFNTSTCAYDSTSSGTADAYWAEDYGNGWCRVGFADTTDNTNSCTPRFYADDTGGSITSTGDGSTVDFYVWGAQAEWQSAYATSYIATAGSTVTRSADSLYYPGGDNWTHAQGTVTASMVGPTAQPGTNGYVFQADDGTGSDRTAIYIPSTTLSVFAAKSAGSGGSITGNDPWFDGTDNTATLTYQTDELILYVDGVQDGSTDTTFDPFTDAATRISPASLAGSSQPGGYIHGLQLLPEVVAP